MSTTPILKTASGTPRTPRSPYYYMDYTPPLNTASKRINKFGRLKLGSPKPQMRHALVAARQAELRRELEDAKKRADKISSDPSLKRRFALDESEEREVQEREAKRIAINGTMDGNGGPIAVPASGSEDKENKIQTEEKNAPAILGSLTGKGISTSSTESATGIFTFGATAASSSASSAAEKTPTSSEKSSTSDVPKLSFGSATAVSQSQDTKEKKGDIKPLFGFGTPNTTSGESKPPSLSFGAPSATPGSSEDASKTNAGASFTFGTPATSGALSGTTADNSAQKIPSFSFGHTSTSDATPSTTDSVKLPTFKFGTSTTQPVTTVEVTPSATSEPTKISPFIFGTPNNDMKSLTTATETSTVMKSSTFTFGAPDSSKPTSTDILPSSSSTTTPASLGITASSVISTTADVVSGPPKPPFTFGATQANLPSTSSSTATTTPSFTFGAPSTGNQATSLPNGTQPHVTPVPLTFGSTQSTSEGEKTSTLNSTNAPFSFNFGGTKDATSTTNAAKPPVFSFGSATNANSTSTEGGFAFGSKPFSNGQTQQQPQISTATSTGSSNLSLTFGQPTNANTNPPLFSSNNSNPPVFTFGASSNTTNTPTFGTSNPPTPFQFGSSSGTMTPSFGAPSGGFGQPVGQPQQQQQQPQQSFTFGSGFNTPSQANGGFGASSASGGMVGGFNATPAGAVNFGATSAIGFAPPNTGERKFATAKTRRRVRR
ncbi:uncharacterized protein VTP21DRAFT_11682 [Calcarisporiella thermophila]|uniref:uncharacterized protein n=1 Tax=Calcarisporiella thermophila TaxID=911321 RepID=UPI0037443F31